MYFSQQWSKKLLYYMLLKSNVLNKQWFSLFDCSKKKLKTSTLNNIYVLY